MYQNEASKYDQTMFIFIKNLRKDIHYQCCHRYFLMFQHVTISHLIKNENMKIYNILKE